MLMLTALRSTMKEARVDAFLVPRADRFQGEYVAPADERLAWLTGFLVPGASGGLGVREATMLLLLTPQIGEPTALALALSTRLITTLGDVLFAGSCRLLRPESIGHRDDR